MSITDHTAIREGPAPASHDSHIARVLLEIDGIVQGVGFRPFVYRLARAWRLCGRVRNQGGRVLVEVEGPRARLRAFAQALRAEAPAGARIVNLTESALPLAGDVDFRIEPSIAEQAGPIFPAPDRATCAACLADYDDPRHRLHGYALISCTECGPKFSVTRALPFDRESTAQDTFPMCAGCRSAHADPCDRRFHAVLLACADCGPGLRFQDWLRADPEPRLRRPPLDTDQTAIAAAISALRAGRIGAIAGTGGYQLLADATAPETVARLRQGKRRHHKPFAVLFADLAQARRHCVIEDAEAQQLTAPERPVVLLHRKADSPLAPAVAAGSPLCGALLPNSPLLRDLARGVERPLVLTSGNAADEPMATTAAAARRTLVGIADFSVEHDRIITQRNDDSVLRVEAGRAVMLRRARGFAPIPIELAAAAPAVILGAGAEWKSTFTMAIRDQAFVSQHVGDHDCVAVSGAFDASVDSYQRMLGVTPAIIAHDLHPDFISTRWARARAAATGAILVPVQHHHAHFAATLIDNAHRGPAIGIIGDGFGLGTDGAAWGGEVFIGDAAAVRRFAHLRYVPLWGGDRAAQEGFRMALSHLRDAGLEPDVASWRLDPADSELAGRLLARRPVGPSTSSLGRLFDAVSAQLGICSRSHYEGQAASELEWAATAAPTEPARGPALAVLPGAHGWAIDTRPLLHAIAADRAAGIPRERIARRFHVTLAEWLAEICARARRESGIDTVALGGGVFGNALLLELLRAALESRRFAVLAPSRIPSHDGGISLGQVAVAIARQDPSNQANGAGGIQPCA